MVFIFASLLLLILWVLNSLVGANVFRVLGPDNALSKNCVNNGNNIFSRSLGIIGSALAYYFFNFLKWPIVGYYGFCGALEIVLFAWLIATQIIIDIAHKRISFEWFVALSNMFSLLSNVLVLALVYFLFWL